MRSRAAINDCWNKIGIHGDSSCERLERYIHCRNCPVYSQAAVGLLDTEVPADYLAQFTRHVAREKPSFEVDTLSLMVFRLATEWVSLPSSSCREVASERVIHSLPHRRHGAVPGLANIRGELLVCVSLKHILGIESTSSRDVGRVLVIQQGTHRTVCPVDQVHGIERFHSRALKTLPTTLADVAAKYTRAVVSWQGKSVGVLDADLLFYTINRVLQSATPT